MQDVSANLQGFGRKCRISKLKSKAYAENELCDLLAKDAASSDSLLVDENFEKKEN